MRISFAGIVVLIMTIYMFIRYKKIDRLLISLFTLNLLYEGFINVGFFAVISSQSFRVADFMQVAMLLVSVLVLLHKKISTRLCVFIFVIFASVVSLLIFPLTELVRTFDGLDFVNNPLYLHYPSFDTQTIKTSLRLICFALNAYAISTVISNEQWQNLKRKYFKLGRIVIVYVWIEFVIKNIVHSTMTVKVIDFIFGSDTAITATLVRNGLCVLVGFNNEPSQFAMMLYSYLLIYMISGEWKYQTKPTKYLTLSSIILMILCGSFRPVAMLPILLLIYLIISEKPAYFIVSITIVAFAIGLLQTFGMLDYYMNRITNAITFLITRDTTMLGGEAGRLNTILEAFQVFTKRPLLGIGPGQTFAYGFIPSILAMAGLFGLATWYRLIFGEIGGVRYQHSSKTVMIILAVSFSWIYTDSIAIAYSIYVLGIAFALKYDIVEGNQYTINSIHKKSNV